MEEMISLTFTAEHSIGGFTSGSGGCRGYCGILDGVGDRMAVWL